jgi:hypothetical protein
MKKYHIRSSLCFSRCLWRWKDDVYGARSRLQQWVTSAICHCWFAKQNPHRRRDNVVYRHGALSGRLNAEHYKWRSLVH